MLLQTLPGPLVIPFVTLTSFLIHSLDLEQKRICMAARQKECLLFINYEQLVYFCNWQFYLKALFIYIYKKKKKRENILFCPVLWQIVLDDIKHVCIGRT